MARTATPRGGKIVTHEEVAMDEKSLPPASPAPTPTPADARLAHLFRRIDPDSPDAWASEALRQWLAAHRQQEAS